MLCVSEKLFQMVDIDLQARRERWLTRRKRGREYRKPKRGRKLSKKSHCSDKMGQSIQIRAGK